MERAHARNRLAQAHAQEAAEQVDGVSVLLDTAPNGQPASGTLAEMLLKRRRTGA